MRRITPAALTAALIAVFLLGGCSEKKMPYDTNLLKNGSFEEVGDDGLPRNWDLVVFRGLPSQPEVRYRVDSEVAHDGDKSWQFIGDLGTRRWYLLRQEVEVQECTHVRLSGWMQTDQVILHPDQFSQCNFLLTFYDKDHSRFQELRVADKRTRVKQGTHLWFQEDQVFRVPRGTRYIEVSCILAMDGRVWFDDVSLSVPKPIDWEQTKTKNFVYHWLPGNPPPEGAIENQQAIFDDYAGRLGIGDSDVVIYYYYYPDTTTIQNILSLKGYQYVSWDDQEFHSINPNDDHELVHFMLDPYGMPPRSIAEGTVYWLWGTYNGLPIRPLGAYLLANDMLASLNDLTTYNNFMILPGNIAMPSAAVFVDYLIERYGTKKFLQLHEKANGVNSYTAFSRALEAVYGETGDQIQQEFRAALSRIDYSQIPKMLEEQPEK